MLIIDSHIHMFDIYGGFDISRPLKKIPVGLLSVLEWFNFYRPGAKGRQTARLIGDLVVAASCKRIQLCNPDIYLNYFDKNRISHAALRPGAGPPASAGRWLSIFQTLFFIILPPCAISF